MALRFERKEPGVWISALAHAVLLGAALLAIPAPALPDAEEGVPVEVITENQFSELTRGERNAEKPQEKPNQADRVSEKREEREPENAKVDKPAAPTRTEDMKLASVDEIPLRAETADPAKEEAEAAAAAAASKAEAAKAEAAKAEAAKAEAAKAAEAKAEAAKAAAAKAATEKAEKAKAEAVAKAETERREELQKLIEREEAEQVAKAEAAKKAEAKAKAQALAQAQAKAEADAKAKAEADAKAKAEAKAEAQAKAEAFAKAEADAKAKAAAEHQKQLAEAKAEADAKAKAEAKAKSDADAKAKAEAAAKAKARALAEARAKADAEAKARRQAELAQQFNAGDIRETLASRAPSQSTGSTGRDVQRTAALGAATGTSQRLSPSMRDALVGILQQQIERCYSAPPGAAQGVILPMLDIKLNADGSLTTDPRLMRSGQNAVDQSIAQAALRAVRRCAPYKIPAQYAPYYNDWKAINAEFEFSRV